MEVQIYSLFSADFLESLYRFAIQFAYDLLVAWMATEIAKSRTANNRI